MKDVQKIMDNDIQSVMEKNMQILIEKDITKLIERETKKTVKENIDVELDPYNTRLTEIDNHIKGKFFIVWNQYNVILDLQANTGKGPASGRSGAQDDEIKKELEKFKTLIDKIQKELIDKDKTNSDIERKIENINSNITGIEKTVKGEIDKTFNNQNENHKAVTNQLTKLFDQFQTLQNKIEK